MNRYGSTQDLTGKQSARGAGHTIVKAKPTPKRRGKVERAEVAHGDFLATVHAWMPGFRSQVVLTRDGKFPTAWEEEHGRGIDRGQE